MKPVKKIIVDTITSDVIRKVYGIVNHLRSLITTSTVHGSKTRANLKT